MGDCRTSPPVSPSPDEAFRRRGGFFYDIIHPLDPTPLGKEGEVRDRDTIAPLAGVLPFFKG